MLRRSKAQWEEVTAFVCAWNVPELWHTRWLMPGLLMLRNCFRSQGNVAMWVRISATGHGTVMNLFPASKNVLAKRGSHEEGACIRLVEKVGRSILLFLVLVWHLVWRFFHKLTLFTVASISVILGARVDQQVHYMELVAVLRWNRQAFYQGLWKSNFAVKFIWFSSVTHSAVYVSFETLLTVNGSE